MRYYFFFNYLSCILNTIQYKYLSSIFNTFLKYFLQHWTSGSGHTLKSEDEMCHLRRADNQIIQTVTKWKPDEGSMTI